MILATSSIAQYDSTKKKRQKAKGTDVLSLRNQKPKTAGTISALIPPKKR